MGLQRLHFPWQARLACYSRLPGVVYTVEEITSVGSQTAIINSRIQSFSSPKWTLQHQDVTSFFGLPFLSNSVQQPKFFETPILPYNSFFAAGLFLLPLCSFCLGSGRKQENPNWVVPTNPPKLNEWLP